MIKINLSEILGRKRINQIKLSQQTGIRPNTISDIYHEVALSIRIDQLDKICEALECDIGDLLEYKDSPIKRTGENLIIEEHKNQKHHSKSP